MKVLKTLLCLTALSMMQSHIQAEMTVQSPLYQVAIVQSPAKAINYRNLKGPVIIDFKGTVLIPNAQGTAKIRNKAGTMTIETRFENLTTPPSRFGREYLTYVLWAVSPEGQATNLGELIIKNGKSKLEASTPLQALSLILTAEPYFAASLPSNVVVMENAIRKGTLAKIETTDAKYALMDKGQYILNVSESDIIKPIDKKTPFMVYQARNAVSIAKAAGAETYAPTEFKNAQNLLAKAENEKNDIKSRNMTARDAVQIAEASRLIAVKLQGEESLEKERYNANTRIERAKFEAEISEQGRTDAEVNQLLAEQARGKSDTERAIALQSAQNATADSNQSKTDAKYARAETQQVKNQMANEKAALRAQLYSQFNLILQTRETARGLIVNMSDVLFQTGSHELKPQSREKLSKLSGIVLANPGLKLQMEGYTDSVGSDELNQKLSEKRAQAVRNYLVGQGLPAKSIASLGFGKTNPIASNDTAEGRQKNRRVEMVVTGEAIGF